MEIYNVDYIPGKNIELIGLVSGTVVKATHVGRDVMAIFKTLVGGEIETYTEMLTEARTTALDRMISDAENQGADAVINVRFGSASLMNGAAEIIAYGTGVRFLPPE